MAKILLTGALITMNGNLSHYSFEMEQILTK